MSDEVTPSKVLVVGTYQATDAYPNVKYKVEGLVGDDSIECIQINYGVNLAISYRSGLSKILSLSRISLAFTHSLLKCLFQVIRYRSVHAVYIPYPATPVLFAISFVPEFLRPRRIVADIFISLYDTIVLDRKLLRERSLPSRLLRRLEKRALSIASGLVTDTAESASHIAELLQLDINRFLAIPLATNEEVFTAHASQTTPDQPLTVIFIGTLVPLHGIDTILDALERIESNTKLKMTFVGDGQDHKKLETFLASDKRCNSSIEYQWIRTWQSSEQLHELIRKSDLCIGIMKHTGKSARVWPFKNYLYMACERALITSRTPVSTDIADNTDSTPFITVNTKDSSELAEYLNYYSTRRSELAPIARSGRQLYDRVLSNAIGNKQLKKFLIAS
ncbi:MAG: glycosyltransferase [Granulosicoccus sp.]